MRTASRVRLISVAGLLATVTMMTGCGKKTEAKPMQAGPPEVGVVTVQPQRVALTTELTGRTSPFLIAEVRPQASGIIQKRAVVITDGDGNDAIAIRPMVYLSFVFDHRILDGASADAFLAGVKGTLEKWA